MTATLPCESCGTDVPRGLATVRTTLRNGIPAPVAWCRTCRPVVAPTIPAQRRRALGREKVGA